LDLYLEFFKKTFQERYVYRFDFYISIVAGFISLSVQLSIWTALYHNHASINSITLPDMLKYIVVSTFVTVITASGVGRKIAERVSSGAIVSDLIKPVNFKYYLLAEDLGNNLFQLLFVFIPTFLIAVLVYGVSLTVEPFAFVCFLFSLTIGIFISFHINYILGLLAFWLHTSWYLSFVLAAFNELFSGSFVPLWFYPKWLYTISSWLPFKLVYFDPISIYIGKQTLDGTIKIIGLQFVWLLILLAIERIMWTRAQHKLIIHGG